MAVKPFLPSSVVEQCLPHFRNCENMANVILVKKTGLLDSAERNVNRSLLVETGISLSEATNNSGARDEQPAGAGD